jgi:hypothetical protein
MFLFVFIWVILLPSVFGILQYYDNVNGLIWLFFHQLYYYPLLWVGEPFFIPDSDIVFRVSILGRLVTGGTYIVIYLGVLYLVREFGRFKK